MHCYFGNPSLAVLDEPSAGVDPAARKKLHRVINAVKTEVQQLF